MALDFLNDIGNLAGSLSSLSGPVGQILNAFRGNNNNQDLLNQIIKQSTNRKPSPAETQAMSYLQALAQPNNSLVNSLTQNEFQNLRAGQQMDINSKVLADRREQAMGRAPVYFDPERANENISYQISRGTPLLQQQAQQNAIQRILDAAGIGKFATNADTRQQNNLNSLASVYALKTINPSTQAQPTLLNKASGGLDGLQKILSMFQQGQNPVGNNIQWNQLRYNG